MFMVINANTNNLLIFNADNGKDSSILSVILLIYFILIIFVVVIVLLQFVPLLFY